MDFHGRNHKQERLFFPVFASAVSKQKSTVAEQTKKRSTTRDTTSKISENPKDDETNVMLRSKQTVSKGSLNK